MGAAVDTVIRYAVMIGGDGEYSLCRAERCPPPGWRLEGTVGTRAECVACVLAHAGLATYPAPTPPADAGTDAAPPAVEAGAELAAARRPGRGPRRGGIGAAPAS